MNKKIRKFTGIAQKLLKQNKIYMTTKKYKRKIGYFQKIQMVKLSKDNKIKNQKIQNLQIIKTKQKDIVFITRQFQ